MGIRKVAKDKTPEKEPPKKGDPSLLKRDDKTPEKDRPARDKKIDEATEERWFKHGQ
jgi:hypothetical protein